MAKLELSNAQKFEALKLRFKDQTELLSRLTMIDLKLFFGYLTLQLVAGSWLVTNMDKVGSWPVKIGLILINIVMGVVALVLLHRQTLRRDEVVKIVKNCCIALKYKEPGIYVDDALDVEMEQRRWFPVYCIGIVTALLGFILIVLGNSICICFL